jgi:Component of IIS longevity pathway SMK-1
MIASVPTVFEDVCSCLEYDPDLREKANHRWFLRERAKFRTVVPMDDPELVSAIHRSFRVNYLRDTLLRPTMDESSLSTLSSLQTFTHADVVRGVTMSMDGGNVSLKDSYLVRVIRMLGVELHALAATEWNELESLPVEPSDALRDELWTDASVVVGKDSLGSTTWRQYLAPQDSSSASRRMRRRGSLSFLRELFSMVRISLQQSDKDDFFAVICSMEIDLNEDREISDNVSQTSQTVEVGSVASTAVSDRLDDKLEAPYELPASASPVNLLSLLANILSDPTTDVTEKGSVLEIVGGVAMHDPGLIRRHCLEYHKGYDNERQNAETGGNATIARPSPNGKNQVLFLCPPNDLMGSLLFLLDVENDAGILLPVTEIMRIVLDTDMMGDHGPVSAFADEAEPPGSIQGPSHDQHNQPSGSGATSTEQKEFLSLFYEHYVGWLVAPFQFTVLHPVRRVPDAILRAPSESSQMEKLLAAFHEDAPLDDPLLKTIGVCAIRSSFAVELLSFCVRAHLYRMRLFLLKSRVLGSVLKLLRPQGSFPVHSGDRCLKLAALRFLRAILSVNDDSYHRHIIQHDLFAPVFESFRANPVGDNLVSSAIVEMCDFIHSENIKSLLEYIVTKHLSTTHPENASLEDVSSPYVTTLTVLRGAYEANLNASKKGNVFENGQESPGGTLYFSGGAVRHASRLLSGKALEDQRKFREIDEEESYFESDDEENGNCPIVPPAIDEVVAPRGESEMHRTPRMFSLASAPLLNILEAKAIDEERQLIKTTFAVGSGSEPIADNNELV